MPLQTGAVAPARRRWLCLTAALCTLPLGIAIRMAPLGLPGPVTKYGGSALWAILIYWLVACTLPQARPARIAVVASVIAVAVECFKLVRTPALDAFRLTLAGRLVLGRIFSGWDILVYGIAIAAVASLDQRS